MRYRVTVYRPAALLALSAAIVQAASGGEGWARFASSWLIPQAAQAQGFDRQMGAFHEALDPHGAWLNHPRYGEVWSPYANQDPSWRPYSRGQWLLTADHGWYWESDEPWGWAAYHYGRWLLDPRARGWIWVPGREWAPAWVAWRQSEEIVGWAPLPPDAEWFAGDPRDGAFDAIDHPRFAGLWLFVAPAYLTAPGVYRHVFAPGRNMFFHSRTTYVSRYDHRDRRFYNRGVDVRFIERYTHRPVVVTPVRPMGDWHEIRRHDGGGREFVGVYRPDWGPGGRPGPGYAPGFPPGPREPFGAPPLPRPFDPRFAPQGRPIQQPWTNSPPGSQTGRAPSRPAPQTTSAPPPQAPSPPAGAPAPAAAPPRPPTQAVAPPQGLPAPPPTISAPPRQAPATPPPQPAAAAPAPQAQPPRPQPPPAASPPAPSAATARPNGPPGQPPGGAPPPPGSRPAEKKRPPDAPKDAPKPPG